MVRSVPHSQLSALNMEYIGGGQLPLTKSMSIHGALQHGAICKILTGGNRDTKTDGEKDRGRRFRLINNSFSLTYLSKITFTLYIQQRSCFLMYHTPSSKPL